ncbi:MAG: hypothetical protein QXP51_05290, partial [Candidatus Hadarchaeales archaeon]
GKNLDFSRGYVLIPLGAERGSPVDFFPVPHPQNQDPGFFLLDFADQTVISHSVFPEVFEP